jgi:hypothetical protein
MEPYTAIPNWIIDDVMPVISPASAKVLMYVLRRTAGWQRESDAISVRQFSTTLNLSKPTVLKALKELIGHRVIAVDYGSTHGDRDVNVYSVLGSQDFLPRGQDILPPSKKDLPRGQDSLPEGGQNILPGVVKKIDPYIKKDIKKGEKKEIATRHSVSVDESEGASKAKASSKRQTPDTRDDRLDSWQIMTYRELARLTPPHAIRDRMIAEVTEQQRWWQVIQEWIGKGWSPRNIAGMLDYYRNNGRTHERREGRHDEPRRDPAEEQRAMEEYFERNKKWLDPEYREAWINGTNTY